ncbi:hypothetical protein HHI36_014898 [Cryptolaemus montrouzieri]|uniref:Uncharacterized protein n=1 Tax=Cryptolaemus montrouzieri TaxID=559131 RepID=A0ABD2N574_9CUCU
MSDPPGEGDPGGIPPGEDIDMNAEYSITPLYQTLSSENTDNMHGSNRNVVPLNPKAIIMLENVKVKSRITHDDFKLIKEEIVLLSSQAQENNDEEMIKHPKEVNKSKKIPNILTG